MARVDQMYCTHCLPRDAVFGEKYTVRAASLAQAAESKNLYFQVISELLRESGFYKPPRDMPAEKWTSGRAENMPARLVSIPTYRGYRILSHVFYRTHDSSGTRVGSYFAHLLFQATGRGQPWRPEQCLQLWMADGWKRRDTPDDPKSLDAFEDFAAARTMLLNGLEPRIDRQAMHRFLTADADQAACFADPDAQRFCRQTPPEYRQGQLAALMQGLLQSTPERRPSLLLVADPGVAVFYFFGILTLLPVATIPAETSFSTYETRLDQSLANWIATTFYDPLRTDLTATERQQAAFWLNAFRNQHAAVQPHPFPEQIIRTFVEDPHAAGQMLDRCQTLQVRSPSELHDFVRLHQSARAILTSSRQISDESFADDAAQDYTAWLVRDHLAVQPVPDERIARLAQSPNIRCVLRFLFRDASQSAEMTDAMQTALRFLPHLSSPNLAEIAEMPLPLDYRCRVLHEYADREKRLPAWFEALLTPVGRGSLNPSRDASETIRLLDGLVELSTPDLLVELQVRAFPHTARSLLRSIFRSGVQRRASRRALWHLLAGAGNLEYADFHQDQARTVGCRAVIESWLQAPSPADFANAIVPAKNPRLILWLLIDARDPQASDAQAVELTDGWSEPLLKPLVDDHHLPVSFRAQVLARRIVHESLPQTLRQALLLGHRVAEGKDTLNWEKLRSTLFSHLNAETIKGLYKQIPAGEDSVFLRSLLRAITEATSGAAAEAFARIRNAWSAEEFDDRVMVHEALLVDCCEAPECRSDAEQRLRTLASADWNPQAFSRTIDVLDHLVRVLGRQDSIRQRATDWQSLRNQLVRFAEDFQTAQQSGDADELQRTIQLAQPIEETFTQACDACGLDDYADRKRRIGVLVDALVEDGPMRPMLREALQIMTVYDGVQMELLPPASPGVDITLDTEENYPGRNLRVDLSFPTFFLSSLTITVEIHVKDGRRTVSDKPLQMELSQLQPDGHFLVYPSNVETKKGKQEPSLDLGGIADQNLPKYHLECVWSIEAVYWHKPLRTAILRWNLGQLKRHHRNRLLLKDGQGRTQRDLDFLSGLLSRE
jgi:hypothetical protein